MKTYELYETAFFAEHEHTHFQKVLDFLKENKADEELVEFIQFQVECSGDHWGTSVGSLSKELGVKLKTRPEIIANGESLSLTDCTLLPSIKDFKLLNRFGQEMDFYDVEDETEVESIVYEELPGPPAG